MVLTPPGRTTRPARREESIRRVRSGPLDLVQVSAGDARFPEPPSAATTCPRPPWHWPRRGQTSRIRRSERRPSPARAAPSPANRRGSTARCLAAAEYRHRSLWYQVR
jgi:hypothetical protein